MAIVAVSRSLISPTRIMSGSARKIVRRADAKVSPALLFTWIWFMPSSWYSTGSSTVITFFEGWFRILRVAYKVVVLPEPVGPVTSTVPYGLLYDSS